MYFKTNVVILFLFFVQENIVEMETTVPSKHHRHFIAHRAEVLGQLAEEYGGVMMSFPRIGMNSEKVTVKGAKECVEGAIKRIGEIVAELVRIILYTKTDNNVNLVYNFKRFIFYLTVYTFSMNSLLFSNFQAFRLIIEAILLCS